MKPKLLPLLSVVLILTITSVAHAQSDFYIKVNPYYAVPINRQVNVGTWAIRYNAALDRVIENTKLTKVSFGQGFGGNLTIGKMAHPNLGFELTASYLRGDKQEFTDKIEYQNSYDLLVHNYRASCFSIIPSLLLQAEIRSSVIYTKFGPIFAFPSLMQKTDISYVGAGKSYQEFKYTGKPSVGFNTIFGFEIGQLGEHSTLFGEVSFSLLNFFPSQRETITYTVNGKDSLSTLTPSELLIEYADEYTTIYDVDGSNWEEDINPNQPYKAGTLQIPLSGMGVTLGIKFYLTGHKRRETKPASIQE